MSAYRGHVFCCGEACAATGVTTAARHQCSTRVRTDVATTAVLVGPAGLGANMVTAGDKTG